MKQQLTIDRRFMMAAIRLARAHEGLTGTNPSVACLIVRDDVVVGVGVTAPGGRPHAEPIAIAEAGELAKGATAYVTLEPCAHHGRTPPCAQALIDCGVARVVAASTDPDNRVSGRGFAMLREVGIDVAENVCDAEAAEGLAAYLTKRRTGLPHVTLKLAMSRTGVIGIRGNGMVPITGDVANRQTHLMRARADAIIVGAGTVLADDPRLDCRLPGLQGRSPTRVILDRDCQLTKEHKVVTTAAEIKTIIASVPDAPASWREAMIASGCEIAPVDLHRGRIALPELIDDLGSIGITSVFVEGGARLAASFLEEDLVDRLFLYRGQEVEMNAAQEAITSPISIEAAQAKFTQTRHLHFVHGAGTDALYQFERK